MKIYMNILMQNNKQSIILIFKIKMGQIILIIILSIWKTKYYNASNCLILLNDYLVIILN